MFTVDRFLRLLACAAALHGATPVVAATAVAKAKVPAVAMSTAYRYSVEPAPAWVKPAAGSPAAAVSSAPLHYRLIDDQVRIEGRQAAGYTHVVRVVGQSAGLSAASQIEVMFDPTCQTLAIHHLDIVRGGQRSTRLDRKRIQLLQRETQLERQMYDGRVTASIVVDDVRVGDEIDFAYTVRGSNPVFDGRYVSNDWFVTPRGPSAVYQLRLLAPEGRRIEVRPGGPDIQVTSSTANGVRETLVRRESVAQLHVDQQAPANAVIKHQVQFSEFADWADVARWGTALFAPAEAEAGAQVDRKAAEIRSAHGSPADRLLAALRFVQADVRYFGTEIGVSSHRPASPEKVLAQRFGDCKDKVTLLIALLRRLDIRASPVLVSTTMRGRVGELLPSPLAFDHVIARVELDGTVYFLDATRGHQTGTLANRQSAGMGQGLVLASGTEGLSALPGAADALRMEVVDRFRVARFADGPSLESRITYRGDLAESMREWLATRPLAELQAQLGSSYARIYPGIVGAGEMTVESSATDDAVTFVQQFTVPNYWRFPEQRQLSGDIVHWSLVDALRFPNDPQRRDAFAMPYRGLFRHATSFEFGEEVFDSPLQQTATEGDRHASVTISTDRTSRRISFTSELRVIADQVAAKDWPAYVAAVNRITPRLGVSLSMQAMGLSRLNALRTELRDLDEMVRSGKLKPVTKAQYDAMSRLRILNAQLEGDRLSPALRAEALTARGIQRDHLGQPRAAAGDFDKALRLTPDSAEALNAAAINGLQTRELSEVADLATRALAIKPSDAEALSTRGIAAYLRGEYTAALKDFDEVLKDPAGVRRGYPLVWRSLGARRGEPEGVAVTDDQLPAEWPRALVNWSRGQGTAAAVIRAAGQGAKSREQLCEAYFYLAERSLADGDVSGAKALYRKALDQGVTEFIEDGLARQRLATL